MGDDVKEVMLRSAAVLAELDRAVLHDLVRALKHPLVLLAYIQAELHIRDIADEFGLLTPEEAPESAAQGVALTMGGIARYPGFQFDGDKIKPVIHQLLKIAERLHEDHNSVIYWLCSPTTYIRGDGRPVELVDQDPDELLRIAENAWGVVW